MEPGGNTKATGAETPSDTRLWRIALYCRFRVESGLTSPAISSSFQGSLMKCTVSSTRPTSDSSGRPHPPMLSHRRRPSRALAA